jgi:hypothetical protein
MDQQTTQVLLEVHEKLGTVLAKVENIELEIVGNGKPGLISRVGVLEKAHAATRGGLKVIAWIGSGSALTLGFFQWLAHYLLRRP